MNIYRNYLKYFYGINRGIKHDFPFINIHKVSRKVLKTEGEARGFQPARGTLRMLIKNKSMFDRYYCINSTKNLQNCENVCELYFYSPITFSYACALSLICFFGPRSVTHN